MGPKAFITCYVCSREFGSRSIPFHEPKCLERWRSSNRSLPPEKRSPTPVKPVGWKHSDDTIWQCTNCRISISAAKRGEHAASCFNHKAVTDSVVVGRKIRLSNMAAGATKNSSSSPKKGKENKNSINNKPADAMPIKNDTKDSKPDNSESIDQSVSTSDKSVRPQTKILRRPTPNLKHPVIHTDSDESGDNCDKTKEENPKRMKHSSTDCTNEQKPKNFIMYNKYNVEKNTRTSPKERAAFAKETLSSSGSNNSSVPFPCNSCSRSVAPERLHSHSHKDTKSLVLKKPSSSEEKTPSPQKKVVKKDNDDSKSKDTNKNPTVEIQKNEDSETEVKIQTIPKICADNSCAKKQNRTLCYICDKEPRNSSLSLHESKCLEKRKKQNGLVSPARRKPIPPKSEPEITIQSEPEPELEPELEEQDQISQMDDMDPAWLAVQTQLVPCPSCSRTFFPERLPVHQRVCKGKMHSGQSLSRTSSLRESSLYQGDEEKNGDKQSIYVPCYICMKNFGSWVIQMHESQCLRKWRRENEKLPEHLQQQEPHKPQLVLDGTVQPSVNPAPDVAWENHLQQLVPCQRCLRTFFPDRLQVHIRSCKGPASKQTTPRSNFKLKTT